MTQGTARQNHILGRYSAAVLVLALTFFTLPDIANASAGSPMGSVLCNIIGIALGNLGRALATLAVICLGVSASFGKMSWPLALTVAVGIAVIFGAPGLTVSILLAAGAGGVVGCTIVGYGSF